MSFGELRTKLNDSGEDKLWRASGEDNRNEEIGRILPTIREEADADSGFGQKEIGHLFSQWGRRFRAILENKGIGSIFQSIGRLTNERWGAPRWEGDDVIMGYFVGRYLVIY